jgi:hypothetical protein
MEMTWAGPSSTEARSDATQGGRPSLGLAWAMTVAHPRPAAEECRAVPRLGCERRGRVYRVPFALWVSVVVSVMVAVGVAYAGTAMARMGSAADLDEPVEVRVIESDLTEPFIVCTVRPQITRCRELDLRSELP